MGLAEPILLVTGKLAEASVRSTADALSAHLAHRPEVYIAKISVAALLSTPWLKGKLEIPATIRTVVLPGLCSGPLETLSAAYPGVDFVRGPADIRDLGDFLLGKYRPAEEYGAFDIEILAEINHANRLPVEAVINQALDFRAAGADRIDLGATPGEPWPGLRETIAALQGRDLLLSIDSFDPEEVANATAAGVDLVLSVNGSNRHLATDWGAAVVIIPDREHPAGWLVSLTESVEFLEQRGVPFRLDPVLDPIGLGFAESLGRYLETRRRFPDAALLMGVGNLTELTEVDSAGVNALLIGFCQELGIQSILTTQVIGWAQGAIAEIAVARQLMKHAIDHRRPPKHLDPRLVMLRQSRPKDRTPAELAELASRIRDPNFRLFAENGELIAINNALFERSADAFELFERLGVEEASHAFYLGWELAKASLALQLGKNYAQDQALDFGMLTRPETSHRRLAADGEPGE